MIIAIDGPAGSGKSTTARLVAKKLGFTYIDTGAMYRAFTLKIGRAKIPVTDHHAILSLLRKTKIDLKYSKNSLSVYLDDVDVTTAIRGAAVTRDVSAVSSIPEVRMFMVEIQRKMALGGNVVLEGRDIGTVVFPDADFKFFMTADIRSRAKRRLKETEGTVDNLEEVVRDLDRRDQLDSSREESPLRAAEDAEVIDNSNLSVDEQVDLIVSKIRG